jgi:hypothetical protein
VFKKYTLFGGAMKKGILGIFALLLNFLGLSSWADTVIIQSIGENLKINDFHTIANSNGITNNGDVRTLDYSPKIMGMTTDGKLVELKAIEYAEKVQQALEKK